jgi:hypothetical protein
MEPFWICRNVLVGVPGQRAIPIIVQRFAPELRRPRFAPKGLKSTTMLVRLSEVVPVLALILALIAAKQVPAVNFLPLAQMTGIVCFSFAIFLALRIYQAELKRIRSDD